MLSFRCVLDSIRPFLGRYVARGLAAVKHAAAVEAVEELVFCEEVLQVHGHATVLQHLQVLSKGGTS
jgi:hypothetical protein